MMCTTGGRSYGRTAQVEKEVAMLRRKGVRIMRVSPKDKPKKLKGAQVELPGFVKEMMRNEFFQG